MEDPSTDSVDYKKRMSLCSQEVCCLSDKKVEKSEVCSSICENSEHKRPPSPIPEKQIAKSKITQMSTLKEVKGIAEESGSSKVKKCIEKTSQEGTVEKIKRTTVAESFQRTTKAGSQQMVSSVSKVYSVPTHRAPTPELLDVSTKPHEIRSLLPPASAVRPLTPTQVVVFPPELPPELPMSRSPSATPQPIRSHREASEAEFKCMGNSYEKLESSESKIKKLSKSGEKLYTRTEVQKIVRDEINKILGDTREVSIGREETDKKLGDKKEVTIRDLSSQTMHGGSMASALTIAPSRPFTPVQSPKPPAKLVYEVPKGPVSLPPETEPYFPPPPPPPGKEGLDDRTSRALREVGCRSPMTEALTIAPDRPYTPLPPATLPLTPTTSSIPINSSSTFQPINNHKVPALPHGKKPISMLSALTVAPQVPFTVPGQTPIPTIQCELTNGLSSSIPVTGQGAFKPVQSSSISSVMPKPMPSENGGTVSVSRLTPKYFPTVTFVPQVKHDNIKMIDSAVVNDSKKVSSGLHEPNLLPYYQQNISEIPACNRAASPAPHPNKTPVIHPPTVSPITVKRSVNVAAQRVASAKKISKVQAHKEIFEQASQSEKSKSQIMQTNKKSTSQIMQTNKKYVKDDASLKSDISEKNLTNIKQQEAYDSYRTHLLPYYQQNIGEIPVRNRSISPVPHPIRAPMINPEPWPTRTTPSPVQKKKTNLLTAKQVAEYEASRIKKETVKTGLTGYQQTHISRKAGVDINKTKQVFKPAVTVQQSSFKEMHKSMVKETYERSLSPCSWKAKVRTVQNLSPIEVRLPSPVPRNRTPKPVNVTTEVTSANVVVKPAPKMSSLAAGTTSSAPSSSKSSTFVTASSKSQQTKTQNSLLPPKNTSHHSSNSSNSSTSKLSSSQTITSKASDSKSSEHHKIVGVHPATSSQAIAKTVPHSEAQYTRTSSVTSQSYGSMIPSYSSSSESSAVMSNGALTYSSSQSNKMSCEAVSYSKSQTMKSQLPSQSTSLPGVGGVSPSSSSGPNAGGGARGTGTVAGSTAPRRGRGVLNTSVAPGARIPICAQCNNQIRGPFITALGKIWCPEHFLCVNAQCRRPLQDVGFVEESEGLYCEYCFEQYLAPTCSKCNSKIKGDCLNAIGKQFHPECFSCAYCGKLFGNNPFFLEDSLPYCETDWNELFTTKCFSCGFPIEAGDRWVEALNNNYHSQCFNCTMCKKNLEGQSFYAKGGRPFCKNHAR